MIFLDSSAIVCAIRQESGSAKLQAIHRVARLVAVGSPLVLEAGMVLSRDISEGRYALEGFLRNCQAEILAFRREHAEMPLSAFLRFGKGQHPAGLN